MPKTTKLTEYEEFKKALKDLETNPNLLFAKAGEYIITKPERLQRASDMMRMQKAIYTRS